MKKYFIIICILLSVNYAYSQCDSYYTSYSCRPTPQEAKDMILSSQSRGVQLEANITYKFQMTLFRNMDYKIIFCTDRKFYPIHAVMIEKETGKVLYDNKDDDYVESIGFTNENTTVVIIEITLLAEGAKFKDHRQNRTCFGMPILFRKIPKLG